MGPVIGTGSTGPVFQVCGHYPSHRGRPWGHLSPGRAAAGGGHGRLAEGERAFCTFMCHTLYSHNQPLCKSPSRHKRIHVSQCCRKYGCAFHAPQTSKRYDPPTQANPHHTFERGRRPSGSWRRVRGTTSSATRRPTHHDRRTARRSSARRQQRPPSQFTRMRQAAKRMKEMDAVKPSRTEPRPTLHLRPYHGRQLTPCPP